MPFWLYDVLFIVLIVLFVLVVSDHGAVVHWSRARALVVLILATVLMAACADLSTEHIKPIISNSSVSQVHFYFILYYILFYFTEFLNKVNYTFKNTLFKLFLHLFYMQNLFYFMISMLYWFDRYFYITIYYKMNVFPIFIFHN